MRITLLKVLENRIQFSRTYTRASIRHTDFDMNLIARS
jgi:hypothetical protein